jgi:hypothetical protein
MILALAACGTERPPPTIVEDTPVPRERPVTPDPSELETVFAKVRAEAGDGVRTFVVSCTDGTGLPPSDLPRCTFREVVARAWDHGWDPGMPFRVRFWSGRRESRGHWDLARGPDAPRIVVVDDCGSPVPVIRMSCPADRVARRSASLPASSGGTRAAAASGRRGDEERLARGGARGV